MDISKIKLLYFVYDGFISQDNFLSAGNKNCRTAVPLTAAVENDIHQAMQQS